MTMAWSGQRRGPGDVEAVATAVLGAAREERGVHPLPLHPQHHHHVALGQRGVDVVGHRARPGVDPDRQQRRGRHECHVGAEGVQQQHVGARDPAVQHVADDGDPASGQVTFALAQVAAHREGVEQGLRGVLVRAIPRVDHRAADPAAVGEPVRRAAGAMAYDDGVGAHRLEGEGGVLEALALGHARAFGGEVDDVGRESFCGRLEGDPGAGGVLEEEVDDGPAAQRGQLADRAVGQPGQLLRSVEHEDRVVAAEVSRRDQVLLHRGSSPVVGAGFTVGDEARRPGRRAPRAAP